MRPAERLARPLWVFSQYIRADDAAVFHSSLQRKCPGTCCRVFRASLWSRNFRHPYFNRRDSIGNHCDRSDKDESEGLLAAPLLSAQKSYSATACAARATTSGGVE